MMAKQWKQPKCPSPDGWINKCGISLQCNLLHATTWVNLENTMLSERSQIQKVTYCMIPHIENNRLIHSDRKQISRGLEPKAKEEIDAMGLEDVLRVMFCILIEAAVSQMYVTVKSHEIVHFSGCNLLYVNYITVMLIKCKNAYCKT